MPANVSTTLLCSALDTRCASAASALACLAAASCAVSCSRAGPVPAAAAVDALSMLGRGLALDGVASGWLYAGELGPAALGSSENIRPIVDRGRWIVRRSPAMGAPSSD